MPFHTSTIAWLGFCMFWLIFVYPRSHSGWIGPIGLFRGSGIKLQQAYRYSIPLSPDLHSIWRTRLAFLIPVHTSTIVWLGFCMFRLSFVYPRSHSGWIEPIGQFNASLFILKPTYRYSIPLSPDLHQIWRKQLAFLMLFHTSTIAWLVFCMFWLSFVYPGSHSGWIGPIGEFNEYGFIRKLQSCSI